METDEEKSEDIILDDQIFVSFPASDNYVEEDLEEDDGFVNSDKSELQNQTIADQEDIKNFEEDTLKDLQKENPPREHANLIQQEVRSMTNSLMVANLTVMLQTTSQAKFGNTWIPSLDKSVMLPSDITTSELVEKLQRSHVILLYSENDNYIENTIEKIALELEKKIKKLTFKQLRLNADSNYLPNEPIIIDAFLEIVSTSENDESQIIKVKTSSEFFLNSVCIGSTADYNTLINGLQEKKLYIICKINRDLMQKVRDQSDLSPSVRISNLGNSEIHYQYIPFVENFIRQNLKDKTNDYWSVLNTQIGKGRWSPHADMESFSDYLSLELDNDSKKLKFEIDKRQSDDYRTEQEKFIGTLPFDQEINRLLLFVAAFFPEITTTEFKRLIDVLVRDKTAISKIPNDRNVLDEEKKVKNSHESIDLAEVWEQEKNEVIRNCKLITRTSKNGRYIFGFEELGYSQAIKIYLERHYSVYILEQFHTIKNKRFYYYLRESTEFLQHFGALALFVCQHNKENFTQNFLFEIYLNIFYENPKINFRKDLKSIQQDIKISVPSEEFQVKILTPRFINLLELFLTADELTTGSTKAFLIKLIYLGQFEHLISFIKALVKKDKIDILDWVKEILSVNPNRKVMAELQDLVVADSRTWGVKTYQNLNKIYNWITHNRQRASALETFGIVIIFVLGNPVHMNFSFSSYGTFPIQFHLLSPLSEGINAKQYFKFLFGWLFYEKRANVEIEVQNPILYNTSSNKPQNRHLKLQVFMVECWLLIITGHSENNSAKANKEEQEQLKNNFVIAFMESLPLQRIKEILAVLSELIIEYSSIILDEKIKRKNAYYYKMYVAKKGAVRTLVQSINNLKNHQSHGL